MANRAAKEAEATWAQVGWGGGAITQGHLDATRAKQAEPASRADTHERSDMAIGPVQLIVLGFQHPEFHGEIIAELERLRESDTVRVVDALAVHKDPRARSRSPT